MERRTMTEFEACRWVADASPEAFQILMKDVTGERVMICTSLQVAAQLGSRIGEAMKEIAKQRSPAAPQIPRTAERVMRYAARPPRPGEIEAVHLLLDGERSVPFLGALTAADAKQLAELLLAAVETLEGRPSRTN